MRITVVGGVYRETCAEPATDRLLGSGLRSASLLSHLGHTVELFTSVDPDTRVELESVAASLDVRVHASSRDGPVGFAYVTPAHRPSGPGSGRGDPLDVSTDKAVVFGMVETTCRVTGNAVVVDPQHGDPALLLDRVKANRVALVLNEHEARTWAGLPDLVSAGRHFLGLGADVVIVKQGALGGLVISADGIRPFPVYPTARVSPVGSGDAFTAGFAAAWLEAHQDVHAAADAGSRLAAGHSLTGFPQVPAAVLADLGPPRARDSAASSRVYLAGPFFSLGQRRMINVARDALTQVGVDVFSPFHDIGPGGDEVAALDLDGLKGCGSVLALLDGSDPGTLFEIGWATRARIPVVAFAEEPGLHAWTMLRGTGTTVTADLPTAVYHAAWATLRESGP